MLETLEQVVETPKDAPYNFTGNDRCDQPRGVRGHGGAVVVPEQAYHRWTKNGMELFFCNHHNAEHQTVLFLKGWDVEHHPLHDQLDKPLDINHIGDDE